LIGFPLMPLLARQATGARHASHGSSLLDHAVGRHSADDAGRAAYAGEIATLRVLAVDCLPGALSDSTFVYLQQAVLGFDGDEIWGKELDHLNDGEIDVQCPGCNEELLLDLQSEDSGIEPELSSELAGRLHAEAVQTGRESVAAHLTRLFGRLSCPSCSTRFNLADHLTGISYQ
jgi:hypothetical protein